MSKLDWVTFLDIVELSSLKLGGIFGVVASIRSDGEPLPAEWSLEVKHGFKLEGEVMVVRVLVEASGPGGELSVDGVGTFEFAIPVEDIPQDYLERFYIETGVPAVIPTVRAAFNDLALRMDLDCAPLGLVKYGFGSEVPDEGQPAASD